MKKTNKKTIKILGFLSLIIILLSTLTIAYYTNTNKFFEDSRKADGYTGFALEREANNFIVDGSGVGTMLDTVTGITWDKNMNHNGATLAWATSTSYAELTWNSGIKTYTYPSGKANYPAFSYCEDLVLGDYNDYRLPSREELMTLVNEMPGTSLTCTTLNNVSFGFNNCQNNYYWTEDEYKSSTSYALGVNFFNGYDTYNGKGSAIYVVCVRRD